MVDIEKEVNDRVLGVLFLNSWDLWLMQYVAARQTNLLYA